MDAYEQRLGQLHLRHEQPWLLPCNRKLRHLEGITIRNVSIAKSGLATQPHYRLSDDNSIPSLLKTPTKVVVQREISKKHLTHSRSAGDLNAIEEDSTRHRQHESPDQPPTRPRIHKLRRRSTMEWIGASLVTRQKRLEELAASQMLDSFFTIHLPDEEDPIYVSEMVERAKNPSFRFFDLHSYGPCITRCDTLTIKLFAKPGFIQQDYQYLLQLTVQLRLLRFIGKSLDTFHYPFPENSVIFHLSDGLYTSPMNLPGFLRYDNIGTPSQALREVLPSSTSPTSSYDALMRLSTLDACIQDALTTRQSLGLEISDILRAHQEAISTRKRVPEAKEAAARVSSAAAAQGKRLEVSRRRRDVVKNDMESRLEKIREDKRAQKLISQQILEARVRLNERSNESRLIVEDAIGQRRRCCEDLQSVFPIEPLPNKTLVFTIRGLSLHNSNFEDVNDGEASAALGFVAQVVHLLSFYLATPLPYPILVRGSSSLIEDPISDTAEKNRQYPLYLKGAIRFRFEYGVFLLNKDIEVLANSLGLRIPDIRQTLPNLKYLLYIAAAGTGELPTRKAGGIRALLRGKADGSGTTTPTLSTAGSDDGTEGYFKNKAKFPLTKSTTGRANGNM